MANRPVSRLSLDPRLCQHLEANNVRTARDVIALSPLDLMELLGLTWSAAHALLQAVSAQVTPPYTTAWEALEQLQSTSASYLHTGMPTLDGALRRGLPCGSITELVGPGGVGKSQLCHMMALRAALPQRLGGLGSGVIYIDTERKFSAVRLAEMARAGAAAAAAHAQQQQQQQQPGHSGDGGAGAGAEAVEAAAMEAMGDAQLAEVLGRVVILNPGSSAELAGVLEALESYVLQHRAQLVVVDSIAALARTEFGGPAGGVPGAGGAAGGPGGGGSIMERQALLGRLASQLKHVAESLQVPVLVTNQVTTRIGGNKQQQGGTGGGGGGQLTAALGTKWAHCVNVRLVLERVLERRFLRVAKSPSCANVLLEYVIGPTGLQQIDTDPRDGLLQSLLQGRGGNALDLAIRNEIDYGDDGAW